MKKILSYLLTLCMLLSLLTGCGGNNAASDSSDTGSPIPSEDVDQPSPNTANADTLAADTPVSKAKDPSSALDPNDPKNHDVAGICAALRESDNFYHDPWLSLFEKPRYGWVIIDDQPYYWDYTYPSNDWSAEAVADNFREYYCDWGDELGVPYDHVDKFYLWTPDYTQMFVADTVSNWLMIDNIPAAPLNSDSYTMNPRYLAKFYQSGLWDGVTPARSADFSTEVVMNEEYGVLEYTYYTQTYSEEADPNHFAWSKFDEMPWWRDENCEFIDVAAVAYPSDHECSHYNEYPDSYYDHRENGREAQYRQAWAIAYPDVPWELQDTLLAVQRPNVKMGDKISHAIYAQRNADGLHALVPTGAQLWRDGRLRQSWDINTTDDAFILTLNGGFYVYADGQVLRLYDDGEVEVLIDNIISVNMNNTFTEYSPCPCFTLEDGVLSFSSLDNVYVRKNNSYEPTDKYVVQTTKIADDVVAASCEDEDLTMYTDASGRTYAIYHFMGADMGMLTIHYETYKVACLGEGSIKDFQALCEDYCAEHSDARWPKDDFIKETANAYASANGLAEVSSDNAI